jgi:hypothetical protein
MAFKTVIRKARVNVSGYTGAEMAQFGQALVDSMRNRITRGLDANDRPLPPLSPRYAQIKGRKYPPPIRNMVKTGRTMRALAVLSANDNRAKVGLTDEVAKKRFNLQAYRIWGRSRQNAEDVATAIRRGRKIVSIEKVS